MTKFPLVELSGSPEEIGYQHGKLLKDRIHQAIKFYHGIFKKPESEIFDHAMHFKEVISQFKQDYATEIEAIAKGAECDPLWIYALNARSEILTMFVTECTVVYEPQNRLLAQNWDWAQKLEELAVIMKIHYPNGRKLVMMTEPGIIGKIGFNDRGFGVCLNYLKSPYTLDGLPIHVMLRALLDTDSLDAASDLAAKHSDGKSGNILIATDEGKSINFEFDGKETVRTQPQDKYVHTNHYLTNLQLNIEEEQLASSYSRYDRAVQIVSGDFVGIDAVKSLLADKESVDLPICRVYLPHEEIGDSGTVCSIVMDLPQRIMHITPGNPFEFDYIQVDL